MRPPVVDHVSLYTSDEKKLMFGEPVAPAGEDRARQEFKAESDTSYLLHRYGVPNVIGEFGVVDYEVSLQNVLDAQRTVRLRWLQLTEEERLGYGSWEEMFAAWQSGQYKGAETPAGSSGGGDAPSPSDSAAEGKQGSA